MKTMIILMAWFCMLTDVHAGSISKEFLNYFKRFAKEAEARHVKLDPERANLTSIRFGFPNDDHALGQCDQATYTVTMSESYWATASDIERESVLFHELGHCILGRSHEDSKMPISNGSVYRSVMNSYGNILMQRFCINNRAECLTAHQNNLVFDPKNNFYTKFRKIYIDELFGKRM